MQRPVPFVTVDELGAWLVELVATYLQQSPKLIDIDVPLSDYGLDSVYALTLSGEIEERLSMPVEPSILWDHPTIRSLSTALMTASVGAVQSSSGSGMG